jgi:membrane peptidoglycan carboxypeptidase
MAFLVVIIPGPIKHQSSFAHGTPGPGLRSLIDEMLAKLRSVDAIDEEEYRAALEEPIVVAGARTQTRSKPRKRPAIVEEALSRRQGDFTSCALNHAST